MAHGEGCWLWDEHGRRYLDMLSAYSAVSHGHAHPRIVQALIAQAQRLAVTSRAVYTDQPAAVPQAPGRVDRARPRAPGQYRRRSGRDRAQGGAQVGLSRQGDCRATSAEIIVCENNFHGRSITIVGFSSDPQYGDGFGPFAPGFKLDPVRRRRRACGRDHAAYGGVSRRADPGRGRYRRSARGLSRRMRAHLPRAARAAARR